MESRAACNLYETTATGCRPAGAARDASRFTLSVRALAELNYPSRSRDGMRRDTAGLGGERWDIRLLSLSLSLSLLRELEESERGSSDRSGAATSAMHRWRFAVTKGRARFTRHSECGISSPRRGEFIQRETEKLIPPARAEGEKAGRRARREERGMRWRRASKFNRRRNL